MNRDQRQQFGVLFRTYLRLSARGKSARAINRGGHKTGWGGLVALTVFYALMGLLVGSSISDGSDLFAFSLLMHTITFLMAGMSLTSESGDLLFNVSETEVLGFLPIRPVTLLLAKSASFLCYTLALSLALNLGPMFFGLRTVGATAWFPLAHLASTIILSFFCAAFVILVYALMIRFINRERFDSIAAWSQILLAVIFMVGSQVLPWLGEAALRFDARRFLPVLIFYPPAWFAAIDTFLASESKALPLALLGGMGLAVTLLLGLAAIPRLGEGYGQGLARLREKSVRSPRRSEADDLRVAPARPSNNAGPFPRTLERAIGLWMRDPAERAVFRMAAIQLRRDTELRVRLYPGLAWFVLLPVIGFARPHGPGVLGPFLAVAMLVLVPVVVTEAMRKSSQGAAAELFLFVPLQSAAPLFHGVRKAALLYVTLPLAAFSVICTLIAVRGSLGSMAALLPTFIAIPAMSALSAALGPYVPFSEPPSRSTSASMVLLFIGAMAAAAGLCWLGFVGSREGVLWYGVAVEALVFVLVQRLIMGRLRRRQVPRVD